MATTVPLEDRATNARKIVQAAKRRARTIAANAELHRSTRDRHVMKTKADAFDQIAAALAGRKSG